LQSGPIRGRAGETAVVITCTQANPALVTLAGDEGFAGSVPAAHYLVVQVHLGEGPVYMALLAFIGFLALQTAGLRRVTLKTDFSESADQGIGKRQIAFPVVLTPVLFC